MLAFGVEVFNFGWRFGAPPAIIPVVIEGYEHWKNRRSNPSGNRFLVWLHTTALRILRSRTTDRLWTGAFTAGRAALTLPALIVLAAASFAVPLLNAYEATADPPTVFPISRRSSKCVDMMVVLTSDFGVGPDLDRMVEQEADKLRGDNILSVEQYDFVKRLRTVTKDRFSGPDTGTAERGWSYEYVQRVAGKCCNAWYPN